MTAFIPIPDLPASAALFLDFDGTLVPIAQRPQDVRVPAWVVPTLARLQTCLHGALAIVSGRPIQQIDAFLQPLQLPAAGAHGAERRGAAGAVESHRADPPSELHACALRLAQRHAGLLFEPKPSGFALHFRARPELEALCHDTLVGALASASDDSSDGAAWMLQRGHCVFEIKQRGVSKATALQAFMCEPAFAGRLPVFVGDDLTDEDGIDAAQAAGGFGVRVGPGASRARHRLKDIDAVAAWLMAAVPATSTDHEETHTA